LEQAKSKHDTVLEVALLAEAPKQFECFERARLKREKSKAKWQREEIDSRVADVKLKAGELRRQYNPELIRINTILDRKYASQPLRLRCPVCGEGDKGNKMNGKPWCFKCNSSLESPNLSHKRFPSPKVLPKTKRFDVTFRRLDE